MAGKLLLIKIGGSLTTNKEKRCTPNPAFIKNFAKGFAAVYREFLTGASRSARGVGPYAHFAAHQYGLREGAETPEQFYGVSVTHREAQQINMLVTQALVDEHIPAFSLAPSSLFTAKNRSIETSQLEPVKLLLANNYMPVVHGDMVLDRTRGASIFSTEVSLQAILETLTPEYEEVVAVYITKTDGVLDSAGKTMRTLQADALVPVLLTLEHDTTGGMDGKVQAARAAARLADRAYVIGPDMQKLRRILAGQDADTRILPD